MTHSTSHPPFPRTRAAARADLVDELLGDLNAPVASPLAETLAVTAPVVAEPRVIEPPRTGGPQRAFSTRLPEDLIALARSAVYHTPGLTLSALVAQALEYELRRLELERGSAFPPLQPDQRIKTGRPVSQ